MYLCGVKDQITTVHMGNYAVSHTAPSVPVTPKSNPLFEFKRVTKEELEEYRVDVYDYIM